MNLDTLFPPADTAETRLARTLFIVEATSFERHALWCNHGHESSDRPKWATALHWRQKDGWLVNVGKLGKHELWVSMTWEVLNGHLVMFYEQTSRVTDSQATERWLELHFKGTYDGGHRRACCDAMNFGHCISAIKEADKALVREESA